MKGEVESRRIRITRAHLEEDAGKLIHEGDSTLVDLNRAGVPLLEIVTEPDFRNPAEAKVFLQNLRNIVRYLGVSDADMEKGHLRCDANVSVRKPGAKELPSYKVEVKNINSFKAVEAALQYEIQRQSTALENRGNLTNETRGWDEVKQITVTQRTKEEAQDYRYFPEPDLPMMHFTKEFVEGLRRELPELPAQKLERFTAEYGLSQADSEVLINDKALARYFEEVVSELQEWMETPSPSPSHEGRGNAVSSSPLAGEGRERGNIKKFAKLASNWITGDFQALLKTANIAPQDARITAENLAELIKMIDRDEISVTAGKKVLGIMFEKGGDPSNIVTDEGLAQVSDETAVEQAIDKVMMENQKAVEDYEAGREQSFGFLVGQVMKELKGKGNPKVINDILRKKLK
jgi:aspartyl-tRNA(Asn)/glutamyl-tRNA(Gln) amidotransferase subunit B